MAGTETLRRLNERTPLRVKLVVATMLMVVAALAGSGVAAVATLRSYLIGRVDTQLIASRGPIIEHQLSGARGVPRPDPDADNSGLTEYVVELLDGTGAIVYGPTSNLLEPNAPVPSLPTWTATQAVAHLDGQGRDLFTKDSGTGGHWRVYASAVTFTDGTTGTLFIATNLSGVQQTVNRLVLLLLVIGGLAVLMVAVLSYLAVRASLRPLRDVEVTAATIAAGDLSNRVPEGDPRTEVGQLSASLNTMLSRIESAFAEREASEAAARRSEELVRESEAEARQSEERMRRFVADASHELRTPLTSIRGFAELYRQQGGAAEPDVPRLMNRIESEASRMGILVEDLLTLARMDQQRPLAESPVDLLSIASDAVHDARALAPDREIALQVGVTDPLPVVTGDEPRLRQVLANLMSNALRHTPAGTPVTVGVTTTRPADDEPATATLSVTDRGPGMPGEDAGRIFERFYRADTVRNRANGGTGLGLAIVAALVSAHGGRVSVDTAPGQGATFRVVLPLAEAAALSD